MEGNPIHILLVEDNPGDARLIRENLADVRAKDFTVETVQTLALTVERCSRPGIDVILLDLGLPDSIGISTLKTVRALAPDMPVVVLTGLDDETVAVQSVQAGAQDYLIKGSISGALVSRAIRYAIARKQAEVYRAMGLEILQILNEPATLFDAFQRILAELKARTGFDAVGIRLQDGEDFPYFAQVGFSGDFLLTENTLLGRSEDGEVLRDGDGKARLKCTCGLVVSGTAGPAHPLFTRGGSFWTNNALPLLDLPPDHGPRLQPCKQCMHHGYASIALVPLRNRDQIVGLIQLCDRRKGCFTIDSVELLEGIASHIGSALMRKRTEDALRESESYIRTVIDSLPIGIAVNSVGGNVNFSYMNDNFPKFYRTTREALSGQGSFWEAVYEDPDFRQEIKRRVLADCASGDPKRMRWTDIPITRKGEETTFVSTMNTPIPGRQLMISAVWDVTELKKAEEELQKMQKLQSIGTLAGGIAHDFNNLLLGLFGNISIALEDLPEEHPSYEPLKEAEKSMSRAVRLTKQLLTFAKGGAPVKENFSLGNMVEEVARFDLTGSNVSLVYHLGQNLWSVDADRGQLQQVVSNLVINARQAMPRGGHLIVTLENADLPDASVPTLGRGRYVKVSMRDEGDGINPKVIDHIFDPYFTTKQTGNGLGLATVWSIINKHGGHIGVVSELGKGTIFTFFLPASAHPLRVETKPPAAEFTSPARPAKILVMDDEEMVCCLASQMLTRCGYSTSTVPDGQEAIALFKQALEAGAPFDLVIMDLTIPGGPGGKEVIQDLLTLDPRVRAIVSSGYADDLVMANPAAYGFKGTVAKPYTASALREAVAKVLA